MFDRLPTEIQEIIIYHLIDSSCQETRTYPIKRSSATVLTLIKLSQVNSKLNQICKAILWKSITYLRTNPSEPGHKLKEDCEKLSSHPSFDSQAQMIRSINIKTFFVIEEVLLGISYDLGPTLKNLFHKLQHHTIPIKHLSLCIGIFLTCSMKEELLDSNDLYFKHFRYFYKTLIHGLKNFSFLTSLEISGTCFRFLSEKEIGQCLLHLPNLTRFQADGYFMHGPDEHQIQSLRLGECLASLGLLEELSLGNMSDPDPSWCDLDWKGPLKTLHLKNCWNFDDDTLCKFICKLPSLKKVRIDDSHSSPRKNIHDDDRIPILQDLESFTSFGSFDPKLINIFSHAPNLQKLHLHTGHGRSKVLQEIKHSIERDHSLWPRLKSMVLSFIHPQNPDRIFIENWARQWNITIKFHHNTMSYSTAWAMGGLEGDQELYHHLDMATKIKHDLHFLQENSGLEKVTTPTVSLEDNLPIQSIEGTPSDNNAEFDEFEQESWDGRSDSEVSSVGDWTESRVENFFPVL